MILKRVQLLYRKDVQKHYHGQNANRPFAGSGHMVRNKLHCDANEAVGLSKQRKVWTGKSSFVLEVPLRHLRPSVIYSVPCDRILQRAYYLFPFDRIPSLFYFLILCNKQTLQVLCIGLYFVSHNCLYSF